MGATDIETMANVTIAKYDFDDEVFNEISADAKDFIQKLLLKDKGYVNYFAYTIFSSYIIFYCLLTKLNKSCINILTVIKEKFLLGSTKMESSQIGACSTVEILFHLHLFIII
jgi:hypothetical protein